jgi:dynein heavy chain
LQTDFKVVNHKQRSDAFKLAEIDVVIGLLDESLTTVSNILGSRYVKRLQAEAETWQTRLNTVAETVEAWKEFQRAWLYLDNIFASPDLRKNCARDAAEFEAISRNWNKMMKTVNVKPTVLPNCQNGQKLLEFNRYNQQMDKIQKNLDAYLEQKRVQFPRFYFLSNDELLQILANAADVKQVERHVNKCFDNICGLVLVDSGSNVPDIAGMVSGEGETVEFSRIKVSRAGTGVEVWLKQVESNMQFVVARRVKEAHNHFYQEKVQRRDWVLAHIG